MCAAVCCSSVEYGTYGYSHTWSVVALADLIADGSAAYYTPNPLDVDSKSFVPMFAFTTSGSVTTAVTAGSPGSSPVGGASIP